MRIPYRRRTDFEHSIYYAVERKIRPERFFVEVIERCPLLFRVIGYVPGVQLGFPGERGQLLILGAEMGFGLFLKLCEELMRPRAGVRHSIFQHQVGKVAIAQQHGLLPAKFKNAQH